MPAAAYILPAIWAPASIVANPYAKIVPSIAAPAPINTLPYTAKITFAAAAPAKANEAWADKFKSPAI